MDRDRVVDVGPNAGLAEVGHDGVAWRPDVQRVLVEDVGSAGRRDRQADRQLAERLVVAGGDRLAPGGVGRQLVQLYESDRRRDVGHPEVVAEHLELVAGPHPLVPVEPQPVGHGVVVGRREAALGGRHVLRRVQAERPVPERPGHPPPERRAVGLAGVLDHRQPVAVGDRPDHVHVGDQPEQVDRADRPRPRRDRPLDLLGVDQVGVGLDVDEDGRGAGVEDGVGRRGERVADGDDLVARTEPEAREQGHQRLGPVAHRDRVPGPRPVRPACLERGDTLALGDHPARQDVGDRGRLLDPQVGAGDRDHAGAP
jgi:hypothetical protein